MLQTSGCGPQQQKILLVGHPHVDLDAQADLLQAVLPAAPIRHAVPTAQALHNVLHARPWDLVICDADHPALTPAAALHAVQAVDSALPLVFVTACASPRKTVKLMRLGARAVVEKSDLDLLIEVVQEELAHRAPSDVPVPSSPNLAAHWSQLQETNAQLEQRVAARTAELARARERFEAIVDHSGDGILLINVRTGIRQANHAFETMLRIGAARYLGESLPAFFRSVGSIPLEAIVADVVATHQTRQVEAQAMRAGGGLIDVEISIAPVNRSERAVENYVCIIRDIGERKRLQAALNEKLLELERFFTVSLDLLSITDTTGRFVKVNQSWERLLGYPAAEIEGRPILDFIHPDDHAQTRAALAQLDAYQPVMGFVNRCRAGDGSYRFIEWRSLPHGKLRYGSARDITRRIRMEEELRASEARYRTTITTMSEGLVVQDATGAIQVCNAAAERILGLTADQMRGRTSVDPAWRTIHEDGTPFPGANHPAMVALQTGKPQTNVVMGVHKPDATLTWILVSAQPLPGSPPERRVVVTTFTEISDLKRAEAQLQENHRQELQIQAYLRALHQITVELTRTESLDDFYRCVVENGLKHFGFERMGLLLYDEDGLARGTFGTDVHGNLVDERHVRIHPASLTGILQKTLDRNRRFAFEEDARLFANGQFIGTGQNAVAALWNGGVLGWLAVDNGVRHAPISPRQLDILALYAMTVGSLLARRHAERKAVELSQRLELAARAGGIGIWEWELATNRIYWDEGMRRIYGLALHDGALVSDVGNGQIHPEDFPKLLAAVTASLQQGTPLELELRILRDDGELRYIKAGATALRDDEGNVARMVGVNLDVTGLKEAEHALRSALEREKEFGELRARFVSMASHEFRTPLAVISATAETLLYFRDRMEEAQIDTRLDRIRRQVDHMVEIMEDVLNLSRIQSGRMDFAPAPGDLSRLCAEIVDEFTYQPGYGERIDYQRPPVPVRTNFDKRLLRLVITNIIHNALKYSAPEQPVVVRLTQSDSMITLDVEDYGIGIPPDDIRHLFEPFHRGANVGTAAGTGLGLSIVKQAVEAHQGRITIASQLDQGTTFTIMLPQSIPEETPG